MSRYFIFLNIQEKNDVRDKFNGIATKKEEKKNAHR